MILEHIAGDVDEIIHQFLLHHYLSRRGTPNEESFDLVCSFFKRAFGGISSRRLLAASARAKVVVSDWLEVNLRIVVSPGVRSALEARPCDSMVGCVMLLLVRILV